MSGSVSDESAQSIGRFFGAEVIVTGRLTYIGGVYRYQVNTVDVETARRGSAVSRDVQNNRAMRNMISALSRQSSTDRVFESTTDEYRMPTTAGGFLDRGILFAMRGEFDIAIMDFTEALELNPNLVGAYIFRGRALFSSLFSQSIDIG